MVSMLHQGSAANERERCPMLFQLSNTAAMDSDLAGALSHKQLVMTPLLVRILALVAVMVLAHLS